MWSSPARAEAHRRAWCVLCVWVRLRGVDTLEWLNRCEPSLCDEVASHKHVAAQVSVLTDDTGRPGMWAPHWRLST
jgi:hypothetical protein